MKSFGTWTTVGPQGEIRVVGAPFAPGDEVEVVVSAKRSNPAEFMAQWDRVCSELRRQAPILNDDEVQRELEDYRRDR